MTLDDAVRIVDYILEARYRGSEYEIVALKRHAMVTEYGWVLPCNTRRFAETGEDPDPVGGLGPAVVDRYTGDIKFLRSHDPHGDLAAFERSHGYRLSRALG